MGSFPLLKRTFFEPRMAFCLFIFFMVGYMFFLDEENAFQNFFAFGPDPSVRFLGMSINTWNKVILVYAVGFISSLLQGYYQTVMYDFIHSKLWNPAYKERIPMSKRWAKTIVTVEPLLDWMLDIVQFFVTMTMRFQFILPQLLGQIVVDTPYALMKIEEKKFSAV
jgi:hypothetical protein